MAVPSAQAWTMVSMSQLDQAAGQDVEYPWAPVLITAPVPLEEGRVAQVTEVDDQEVVIRRTVVPVPAVEQVEE